MAHLLIVFENHEFVDRRGIDAEFRTGGFRIGNEARLESRIEPRAGDELGAVGRRARFLIVDLALNVLLSA